MTGVEWKPIPSLGGRYEASSDGQIRHVANQKPRKFMVHGHSDYLLCGVRIDGKSRSLSVHRLVCEAFHGACPDGHECGHKNGTRQDNRQENLSWITRKENQHDRIRHGTAMKGTEHPYARLNRTQLEDIIFRVGRLKQTQAYVGFLFGVAGATISEIMSCKIYASEWGLKA